MISLITALISQVLETLQYRSHDRHMTKAVKGTTQLTVATLV